MKYSLSNIVFGIQIHGFADFYPCLLGQQITELTSLAMLGKWDIFGPFSNNMVGANGRKALEFNE